MADYTKHDTALLQTSSCSMLQAHQGTCEARPLRVAFIKSTKSSTDLIQTLFGSYLQLKQTQGAGRLLIADGTYGKKPSEPSDGGETYGGRA
jgi:hypothetical protein